MHSNANNHFRSTPIKKTNGKYIANKAYRKYSNNNFPNVVVILIHF